MSTNNNGLVWKVASGALALFIVTAGAMYGMVSVHAEYPHESSVPRREFEMFEGAIDRRLERIETKVDELLAK